VEQHRIAIIFIVSDSITMRRISALQYACINGEIISAMMMLLLVVVVDAETGQGCEKDIEI
jgi:hypothetical protein